LKELSGGGEPNPKPLHSVGIAEHISDLQERGGFRGGVIKPEEPKQQPSSPNNELSEYYRREQERHSGLLENPLRVQRPSWPKKPSEQRGGTEPFQPNLGEQQAAERLGKPPPESGEQEIEALAPSYLDDRSRLIFSLRFDPDRDRLPEYHGWDSLAEVLLDFSGYLEKPEDPGVAPDDYEGQLTDS
jgi:hypothetical protein